MHIYSVCNTDQFAAIKQMAQVPIVAEAAEAAKNDYHQHRTMSRTLMMMMTMMMIYSMIRSMMQNRQKI